MISQGLRWEAEKCEEKNPRGRVWGMEWPIWPSLDHSRAKGLYQRYEHGNEGEQRGKHLPSLVEVRESLPGRPLWAECWKKRMNELLGLGHRPVLCVPSLTHISSLWFGFSLRGYHQSLNSREIHSYVSICPSVTSCSFSSENLFLWPLSTQTLWGDRKSGLAKLADLRFPSLALEFQQAHLHWVWIFSGRCRFVLWQKGKKLTEDTQHIWKDTHMHIHIHSLCEILYGVPMKGMWKCNYEKHRMVCAS